MAVRFLSAKKVSDIIIYDSFPLYLIDTRMACPVVLARGSPATIRLARFPFLLYQELVNHKILPIKRAIFIMDGISPP
jgi:hypothetical protein